MPRQREDNARPPPKQNTNKTKTTDSSDEVQGLATGVLFKSLLDQGHLTSSPNVFIS